MSTVLVVSRDGGNCDGLELIWSGSFIGRSEASSVIEDACSC